MSLPVTPIVSRSEAETEAFGQRLAGELPLGSRLCLYGDLGTGKTVLTRGIARGLGIDEPVSSPTFAIVQEYEGRRGMLYHLDLYRIEGPEAALAFGLDDYLADPEALVVIEWAERLADLLAGHCVTVHLRRIDEFARELRVEPGG